MTHTACHPDCLRAATIREDNALSGILSRIPRSFTRFTQFLRHALSRVPPQHDVTRLSDYMRRDIGLGPRQREDAFRGPGLYEWERERLR